MTLTTTRAPHVQHVPHVPEYVDKKSRDQVLKASSEKTKLNFNVTDGIVIPQDLVLTVPLSDISLNLLSSYNNLQETLSVVSSIESALLSSTAKELFASLIQLANNMEEFSSLSDAIPGIFSSITEVFSRLEIGTKIPGVLAAINTNLLEIIQIVDKAQTSESNFTKTLNGAVLALGTSLQVLITSIGVIVESSALKIGSVPTEIKELAVSLTLILNTTVFIVQSISSFIASKVARLPDITPTSSALYSFLIILDQTLPPIRRIMSLISDSITSSMTLVVSTIGVTVTSLSNQLNASMEKLRTGVIVDIPDKLESILFNLIGSTDGYAKSATTSTAAIASCLSIVSSADAGIQSKIARQLYPVFNALSRLTISDNEIVKELITSLSNISNKLYAATNSVTYGIGVEVTAALIKSVEDIFTALKEIVLLVNHERIHVASMDRITKECAKTVQIFNSIVVAITTIISDALNYANAVTFEAVIGLQLLHSAVLYVVEWVTAVGSSVFLTKVGTTHELMSSLAVIIVVMLQQDSKTIETIANSVNHGVYDVVLSIRTEANVRGNTANTAISKISEVVPNTEVTFEQLSSNDGSAKTVEGINADGNVSQILNDLTGSLSSISSSFTSSLNRLTASLKQIVSSDSKLVQTMSGGLIAIVTQVNELSGSATQILSLTSDSLNSLFGHLLEAASKLFALGDVCISLCASIAQTSTALHSLIYDINSYTAMVSLSFDSVKDVTKSVQVLISTFFAIVHAASNASDIVLNTVVHAITALPYLVSTTILVVQQVLGAAIADLSAKIGYISTPHHKLTLSISAILETLTFITADTTTFVTAGISNEISGKILESLSDLQNSTTSSLSKISGVVANNQVTLSVAS